MEKSPRICAPVALRSGVAGLAFALVAGAMAAPSPPRGAKSSTASKAAKPPSVVARGTASWYGRQFHGRRTASGERFDMHALTAAHPSLPLDSIVRVRNVNNQREVIVRVNDRGPFHRGRILDLSYAAAREIGMLRGLGSVVLELLTGDQLRNAKASQSTGPRTAMATAEASTDSASALSIAADEAQESVSVFDDIEQLLDVGSP